MDNTIKEIRHEAPFEQHRNLSAALGEAQLLADRLYATWAQSNELKCALSAAIRIPDADARADKVMPILAQIEELARKAEALISQNQQP